MTTETPAPVPPAPDAVTDVVAENPRRKRLIIALIALVALLLAALIFALIWYLSTGKPISQIPIIDLPTPPGYSTSIYDVEQPLGVALDEANDRLYVTQSGGSQTVLVFNTAGEKVGELTPPGKKKTPHIPVYVAVDPVTSDVYVSDRATATVYAFDSAGNFLREVRPTGVKTWAPLALAFDKDGLLYVTDVTGTAHTILKMKTDGTVIDRFGEEDGLSFPNGVAVQDDLSVFVADSNNGRVLAYKPDGATIGGLARGGADAALGLPRGMAIDDRGRLYVVDTVNQAVNVYKPDDNGLATYSFSFGEDGQGDGQFAYPNDVAVDSTGHVYVTDRVNNRVQVWT